MFWLTIEEDTREIGRDTGRQAENGCLASMVRLGLPAERTGDKIDPAQASRLEPLWAGRRIKRQQILEDNEKLN